MRKPKIHLVGGVANVYCGRGTDAVQYELHPTREKELYCKTCLTLYQKDRAEMQSTTAGKSRWEKWHQKLKRILTLKTR